MKKKVLIGYTNIKNEEKRVANELYKYFTNIKDIDIHLADFSSYFNNKHKFNIINSIFNKHNNFNSKFIKEFNPDIVISTNLNIDKLINNYNKLNTLNTKIIDILCEISLDNFNKNLDNADYYIVNNNIMKEKLLKKKVKNKKIIVAGTPIFNKNNIIIEDKNLTLKKYSLNNNKPIYLIIGNSLHYIYEYFKLLVKKNLDINIIIITGKDKKLMNSCNDYITDNNINNVLVLGYTKDLYNLINISNVVITKPGTSTLIEVMSFKKPTILLPSTNIEERKNSRYMLKNNLSINANNPIDLVKKVKLTLNYKFIIKSINNKLIKLDDYNSCKIIYDLINKIL